MELLECNNVVLDVLCNFLLIVSFTGKNGEATRSNKGVSFFSKFEAIIRNIFCVPDVILAKGMKWSLNCTSYLLATLFNHPIVENLG